MKISNNALNFLLAQYRAIFKRAYVKGIASAVLLTAGLAAGQAQADIITGGAASWDEVTTTNNVTIADSETKSTPTKGQEYFNNITVQSGGTFNNSGAQTQLVVKGTFTNEGTVNLNQGPTWGIVGYPMNADQSLDTSKVAGTFENKAKATLNISGSQLQVQNVILRNDSTTNISGSMGSNWYDEAMIVADNLQVESGATVTMSGGQLVTGLGGTMNIAGTINMTGNAFLRATDNYKSDGTPQDPNASSGKIVIAQSATVNVNDGASGGIFANDVEVAGKIDINSGSNITIGGDITGTGGITSVNSKSASSNVKVVGGTITIDDGATVAIGGTNQVNGEDVTSTLVVESGTLENNSANVTVSANIQVADSTDAKLTGTGTYKLEDTGALTMSSEKMESFVATGKVDASNGTLNFTDAVDLSSLNIFGNDKIKIGANTVFAGDDVTVTGAIQGLTGYGGSLEQDDVRLGSNTYDGNYNLAKVIAHNTLDLQGKNDQFLIKCSTTAAIRSRTP